MAEEEEHVDFVRHRCINQRKKWRSVTKLHRALFWLQIALPLLLFRSTHCAPTLSNAGEGLETSIDPGLAILESGSSSWQLLVLGLPFMLCCVVLISLCTCCKTLPGMKDISSISSNLSRSQMDLPLQGLPFASSVPKALSDDLRQQIHFESLPDISEVVRNYSGIHKIGFRDENLGGTHALLLSTVASQSEGSTLSSAQEAAVARQWFSSPHDSFPRSQLRYIRALGIGHYGHVLEGRAINLYSDHTSTPELSHRSGFDICSTQRENVVNVVVKTLFEQSLEHQQTAFLRELSVYRELQHPNVLRVLAACLEAAPYLVLLEHCSKGPLKRWLRCEAASVSQRQLLTVVTDVAAGLAHMHEHGFLHKDLATRNCLVDRDLTVKVGDYGLSLEYYKEEYYRVEGVALPLRWCPPESLTCSPTTLLASEVRAPGNVWTFGVLCHEVFTLAAQLPYYPLTDEQVIERVILCQDTTPILPDTIHYSVRDAVQQCFTAECSRPSMSRVLSSLCDLHMQLYGTEHASVRHVRACSIDSQKPLSLHFGSPHNSPKLVNNEIVSSAASEGDLDAKWRQLEQTSSSVVKDHSIVVGDAKPELRFESNFMTSGAVAEVSNHYSELDARVAATFGTGAPSWLGLEPGQQMDSLTREISSAIQRLDHALQCDDVQENVDRSPDHGSQQLMDHARLNESWSGRSLEELNTREDELLPAFVVGEESSVTHITPNMISASISDLPSLQYSCEVGNLCDRRSNRLSTSVNFLALVGLEDEGLSLRLEKDEFSELVKQKSRSVQDLMKLTVVDGINFEDDDDDSNCYESGEIFKCNFVREGNCSVSVTNLLETVASDKHGRLAAFPSNSRTYDSSLSSSCDKLESNSRRFSEEDITACSNASLNSTPSASSHVAKVQYFPRYSDSSEQLLLSPELSNLKKDDIRIHCIKECLNKSVKDSLEDLVESHTLEFREKADLGFLDAAPFQELNKDALLPSPDVTVEASQYLSASSVAVVKSAEMGETDEAFVSLVRQDPLPDIVVDDKGALLGKGSVESLLSSSQDSNDEKNSKDNSLQSSFSGQPRVHNSGISQSQTLRSTGESDGEENTSEELHYVLSDSECLKSSTGGGVYSSSASTDKDSESSGVFMVATQSSLATDGFSNQFSCDLVSVESGVSDDNSQPELADNATSIVELISRSSHLHSKFESTVNGLEQTDAKVLSASEHSINGTQLSRKLSDDANDLELSHCARQNADILHDQREAINDAGNLGDESLHKIMPSVDDCDKNRNDYSVTSIDAADLQPADEIKMLKDGSCEDLKSSEINNGDQLYFSGVPPVVSGDADDEKFSVEDPKCSSVEYNESSSERVYSTSVVESATNKDLLVCPKLQSEESLGNYDTTQLIEDNNCQNNYSTDLEKAEEVSHEEFGDFWQQQMSAWQTAALETRLLLMEAAASPSCSTISDGPDRQGEKIELIPAVDNVTNQLANEDKSATSSIYSPVHLDSSLDDFHSLKKYPKTPVYRGILPVSDDDSTDSSPYFTTARYQSNILAFGDLSPIKPAAPTSMDDEYDMESTPPRKGLSSPGSSSCTSSHDASPGYHSTHNSYVSYEHDEDDMLGYCVDDLNALRAELSLKLPVSPRDESEVAEQDSLEPFDVEELDNRRDHVIINYRSRITLSPIKEEPSVLQHWDSSNCEWSEIKEASANNSSIEFVDCYADSPKTVASESVPARNTTFSLTLTSDDFKEKDFLEADTKKGYRDLETPRNVSQPDLGILKFAVRSTDLETGSFKEKGEVSTCNADVDVENSAVDNQSVQLGPNSVEKMKSRRSNSQLPISSSSVITTLGNEIIPVDRNSLIIEDLEHGDHEEPEVRVYTAAVTGDGNSQTIDSEDLLVVDVDTNQASILEAPKSRSHLAFVHSPPSSPPRIHPKNDLEKSFAERNEENEQLQQLDSDYLDDVDHSSLPYEINSSKDKLLYLKFNQSLNNARRTFKEQRRIPKAFRDANVTKSMDYILLSDPLSDVDFEWQQRSLDVLSQYYDTLSPTGVSCLSDCNELAIFSNEYSNKVASPEAPRECLTTNSPNTASEETSQSSGLNFKLGTAEHVSGPRASVSRYQPYFTSSLNSLSQIDSSLMYSEAHESLPYAVNFSGPFQNYSVRAAESLDTFNRTVPETEFRESSKSLDHIHDTDVNFNRGKQYRGIVPPDNTSSEGDTFIRGTEIDLKDKVMRELGHQFECIKSYKKEHKQCTANATSSDGTQVESSDEDLTSFSLGLLGRVYAGTINSSSDDSLDQVPTKETSDVNFAFKPQDLALDNSQQLAIPEVSSLMYDSDEYVPETDYTESSERRIYEFFRTDDSIASGSNDVIPRPLNPEPTELSDCACTPSPALSLDFVSEQWCHQKQNKSCSNSSLSEFSSLKTCIPGEYKFNATTVDCKEMTGSVTEELVEEDTNFLSEPSPVITPGKLPTLRYRMTDDGHGVFETIPEVNTPRMTDDEFHHLDAVRSRAVCEEVLVNRSAVAATLCEFEVTRESLYTPDWEETDDSDDEQAESCIENVVAMNKFDEGDRETAREGHEVSSSAIAKKDTNEIIKKDPSPLCSVINGNAVEVSDSSEDDKDAEDSDASSETDSSSSGEFLWQAGNAPAMARPVLRAEDQLQSELLEDKSSGHFYEDGNTESESGEEEFTPSTWDASRTPTRSLLKTSSSGQLVSELEFSDEALRTSVSCSSFMQPTVSSSINLNSPQKRSVHWKRERHHRVYEYPPEPTPSSSQHLLTPFGGYSPPSGRPCWGLPAGFSPARSLWAVQSPQLFSQPGFKTSHSDENEFYNTGLGGFTFAQSTFGPGNMNSDVHHANILFNPVARDEMLSTAENRGYPGCADSLNGSDCVASKAKFYDGSLSDEILPPTHQQLQSIVSDYSQMSPKISSKHVENQKALNIADLSTIENSFAESLNTIGEFCHAKEHLRLNLPSLALGDGKGFVGSGSVSESGDEVRSITNS